MQTIHKFLYATIIFFGLYAVSTSTQHTQEPTIELYKKFLDDPMCPRTFQHFKEKPEIIPQLQENYDAALYVFTQFDINNEHLTLDMKYSCYQIAKRLTDPRTIKYFERIRQAPLKDKPRLIRLYEEKLYIRELFIGYTLSVAEQYFAGLQLPQEEASELLGVLTRHKYLLAHVHNDPWVNCIIYNLPKNRIIPELTQLMLLKRKMWVKEKINQMGISRHSEVQRALYYMLDRLEDADNPHTTSAHIIADHVDGYSMDETPEVYEALFNDYHVVRFGIYNVELIDELNVQVSPFIGLKKNMRLHNMYMHLLALPLKDPIQREVAKKCIALIFYATTIDDQLYTRVAEHVYDSIMYDDIPKWIWHNIYIIEDAFAGDSPDTATLTKLVTFLDALHAPCKDKNA